MESKNNRSSNFELMRLVIMWFIVTYHSLCYIYLHETNGTDALLRVIWIPLHIAVICFVLISGYFQIKPTVRGAVRLLLPVIVFYTIPSIIAYTLGVRDYSEWGGVKSLLFLSWSPYWFVRTYLFLFIVAPLLNKWVNNTGIYSKVYMIIALAFISVFESHLGDPSLKGGKNLVLFMLVYMLGNMIREKDNYISRMDIKFLLFGWVIFNVILMGAWLHFHDLLIGKILWYVCFQYDSPILIINAICFFCIFSKLTITSKVINTLASSVFAVYILSGQPLLAEFLWNPLMSNMYSQVGGLSIMVMISVSLMSALFMLACIGIDKMAKPVFNVCQKGASKLDVKFKQNRSNESK